MHGLLRIHQRTIVDFTPGRTHVMPGKDRKGQHKGKPRSRWIKQLGKTDQIVEWFKPVDKPDWMSDEQYAALPASLIVRELRYMIHQKGFRTKQITLVTTLVDADRYPLSELAEQFRQRWEIETNFGHLKTTMKMDVLKCKTVNGMLGELHVFALVYNLVRQVMLEAARRQDVDVFHRRAALATSRQPRRRPARTRHQPSSPGPHRTSRRQTPTQAIHPHEQTPTTAQERVGESMTYENVNAIQTCPL